MLLSKEENEKDMDFINYNNSLNEIESEDLFRGEFEEYQTIFLDELKPEQILSPQIDQNYHLPPTGDLPAQDSFEGIYNFNICKEELSTGGNSWLYSKKFNQIYIKINQVLIIKFKAVLPENGQFYVRAMLMYSNTEYMDQPVNRCTVHAIDEDPNLEAHKDGGCLCELYRFVGHIIRTSSIEAKYCYDLISRRHSLLTPISRPQAGTDSVPISYSFCCQTSCPNGMQRRPVKLILTLENERNQVLGRRVVNVKICSCPKRDKEHQESLQMNVKTSCKKQKRTMNPSVEPMAESSAKSIKLEVPAGGSSVVEIILKKVDALEKKVIDQQNVVLSELKSIRETILKYE